MEISIGGETFNVLDEGGADKAVVMLSNPLGGTLRFWDPQMAALLAHFRVVRYDSRGHGASAATEGPYTIAQLGRDALAILDALAIAKAHWLGLSMGSMTGQWLLAHAGNALDARCWPARRRKSQTADMWNARIRTVEEAGMGAIAVSAAGRWFTQGFRDTHPEKVEPIMEMVRKTPPRGYVAGCAAIRDMDLREPIKTIKNSVLVIAGRHDPGTTPGMNALVANSIEGAKLITLEASHMSNIEDAANFTKAVVDFLTAGERES